LCSLLLLHDGHAGLALVHDGHDGLDESDVLDDGYNMFVTTTFEALNRYYRYRIDVFNNTTLRTF
jgi:hypothetical protein